MKKLTNMIKRLRQPVVTDDAPHPYEGRIPGEPVPLAFTGQVTITLGKNWVRQAMEKGTINATLTIEDK